MTMRNITFLPILALVGLSSAPLMAVEPAQAYLDGLRDRGFFDTALEYLETVAQNPAVPVSFKETLTYEKGVTLVKGARSLRDAALREKQLDEGQQVLQQFVASQPNHLLAISARSELGNVIVERARTRVEKAKKLSANEKQTLHKEANALYTEAINTFKALVDELKVKLEAYPAALDEKKDAQRVAERDRYRQDYLQAQLLVAAAREEMIETLPRGSKEWTDTLTQAVEDYKEVYEKYRTRLAGLYARMYQGRCLGKLNKHKEASAVYNELLANPDAPEEFRTLKVKVMELAVPSWNNQGLHVESIDKGGKLADSARPTEDKSDEMMSIRLDVAAACKAYSEELAKKNPRDAQIKQLMSNGRKLVTYAVRFPGAHQDRAKKMLPDFSSGDVELLARKEPKNFMEARTAATEAINAMQAGNLLIKTLPGRIAATKDTAEKADLQKQLDEAKSQVGQNQLDALEYCKLALRYVDRESSLDDVNLIRYLLCFLFYSQENYYDAAVIGEFLARRYPGSQGARPCAKIAMASYLKLYTENKTEDKDYESNKIVSIADYIVQKWPDQPEAPEALNTLIPFMIREKKLKEAQDYLAKIPVDSPHRGNAELKTGQAMWASYLTNSREIREWESGEQPKPDDVDLAARKAELEELKTKAKQTLVDGVTRMKAAGKVDRIMATAGLSLAQIYVDTNEPQKAVELLEDPNIGLLTLLKNQDPIVAEEGFPEETYKTALRAYISSLAGGGDAQASIEKAKGIMQSLKEQMGEKGQGQLVAIYVSLAQDLKRQMEIADPQVKASLGVGFQTFLEQVAADATELNVLNWVAETYRGMGESFGTNLRSVPKESLKAVQGYYDQAAKTYQKILDMGKTNASFLSPAMRTQIQLQLAKTKRSQGDYVGAMNAFEAILKTQPMMLPVQIEAARTYQDWGGFKGSEENYLRAIMGGRPDKDNPDPLKKRKNVIWGWGEIARMTANNDKFNDQFHESRYNLALCRYNYALSQKDAQKKTDTLKMAQKDIAITVGFYPDLGGEKWRGQYDNLLKTIQKALGERPIGLPALEPKSGPTNSGKASTASAKSQPKAKAKTVPTSTSAAKK